MATATKDKTERIIRFSFEKETKNTHRFQEIPGENDETSIGTLYVSKATVAQLGNPGELTVTLTA